ncbi:PINIT domain-containing protein [Biscogniauxia mediterranea]|nr:PINIT domain-containing protein [Biscogniauxia mediterranea]
MASSHHHHTNSNTELRQLERTINGLLNKHLQNICATHGLRTSGVKAELQNRIKSALTENLTADPTTYNHMRNTILNIRGNPSGPISNATMPSPPSSTSHGYGSTSTVKQPYPPYSYGGSQVPQQAHGYGSTSASAHKGGSRATHDLEFKRSPFYTIKSRIGEVRTCDVMSQHRHSIHLTIKVSEHPDLSNCAIDKSLRIMVLCAGDNEGIQDIAFPYQSEIKVNGGDVKANLRGLKGKPGSTRPVDITDTLRLKQYNYTNNVEFIYALTQKVKKRDPSPAAQKFYLAIYVCQMASVSSLVEKIKGRKIPKTSVIRELTKKANDPDIVTTSTKLSLRCPLSYMRLNVPCRSTSCNHIQCFDANSYLQLQEQGPQWICPICNNAAPFEELAVDEYVKDILENTSSSLEHITIEPDGRWRIQGGENEPKRSRQSGVSSRIDDDDDISIVSDSQSFNGAPKSTYNGVNAYSTPNRSVYSAGTPTGNSREASAPKSGSNKRTAEVIDLTLSSDEEDDEPIIRPTKRQYHGPANGSNLSFHSAPTYGQL